MRPCIDALESRCLLSSTLGTSPMPPGQGPTAGVVTPSASNITIAQPTLRTTYIGGERLRLVGWATGAHNRLLPAGNYHWSVVLHTPSGSHRLGGVANKRIAGVRIPTGADGDPGQTITVTLATKDSSGDVQRKTVTLKPRIVRFNAAASVPGLRVKVDGVAPDGPMDSAAGMTRMVVAPRSQVVEGMTYVFDRWSDGGGRRHRADVGMGGQSVVAIYKAHSVDTTPPPIDTGTGTSGTGTGSSSTGATVGQMDERELGLFSTKPILE